MSKCHFEPKVIVKPKKIVLSGRLVETDEPEGYEESINIPPLIPLGMDKRLPARTCKSVTYVPCNQIIKGEDLDY
jgi:hypothetical protein